MKILITGIHGFVGSNLVNTLKEHSSIYGVDIVAPKREGVIKTFSWQDMDNGLLPEVDAIIHLAGKAHDTKNRAAADIYFKINTELTKKIYNHYLNSSATKFIFFSTAKAAADRVIGEYLTEEVIPSPVGPYGESKIRAEEYILSTKPAEGKHLYILRPCMIHGPGNKGNLNLLYSMVRKGIPWPLGAFENRRTFTSIDNLTYVIDSLLLQEIDSGIYNMADDEALSTNQLIQLICESLGKKAHIWYINRGFITWCARVGGILHLPLNPDRLKKLTEDYVVSNAKIKKAIGIERMPVNARDGLINTFNSFK